MTRDEARQAIRSRWREIAQKEFGQAKRPVNGEPSYICPKCGHGTNGDGLTRNPRSRDGNGLHCFGCGFSGDIIDLYETAYKVDHSRALHDLAGILGISIDGQDQAGEDSRPVEQLSFTGEVISETAEKAAESPQNRAEPVSQANTRMSPQNAPQSRTAAPAAKSGKADATQKRDFTEYYVRCQARLDDPRAAAYLSGRGISLDTARRLGLGFDPEADPAESGYKWPRIIVPTCGSHYIARATEERDGVPRKLNPKGGSPALFNGQALKDAKPGDVVFVTEGAFDALSIIEAGGQAVAYNSAANVKRLLIDPLKNKPSEAVLAICGDADKAGEEAVKAITDGLKDTEQLFIVVDVNSGKKDANEALQAERERFIQDVAAAAKKARKPYNSQTYIDEQMAEDVLNFGQPIKTGFPLLDKQTGGLYPGLYVVAAISSLGKSTFCYQMAEQIAVAGTDVLYFTLEMSRFEMVSKSFARRVAVKRGIFSGSKCLTGTQIRSGRHLTEEVLATSREHVEEVGDRLSIIEGNFEMTAEEVAKEVRRYTGVNRVKPVVFIDYLQNLMPTEQRQTTKETMDSAARSLKQLSRELSIPIIAISSVNRANYLTPISFEAIKESGGIEYTADTIFGLELACLSEDIFSNKTAIKDQRARIDQAKAETPRRIRLKILKCRNAKAGTSVNFEYFPECDYFRESEPVNLADKYDKPTQNGRRARK